MGACCSVNERYDRGLMVEGQHHDKAMIEVKREDDNAIPSVHSSGAYVRLKGSSRYISMFSQQGRKGVNQDAMTVWENFNGDKDTFFCAVFDGHGPLGHKVARKIRDLLPSTLSSSFNQQPQVNNKAGNNDNNAIFSSWKANLLRSFHDTDQELRADTSFDTYCSGTTSVSVLKQGDHLVIANLGDSRAVLCTRDDSDELVPIQLTVDMKPSLKEEADRIKSKRGRVFAMEQEPEVYRIWMPEEDCPGLAMTRAFGDFCLKDFGLISTPEVSYRKLTERDEFLVIATDGVWDVLSNKEVIEIVASARKRSTVARLLVEYAILAWRHKYPNLKIDDCAVICLFFKSKPTVVTKPTSEPSPLKKYSGRPPRPSPKGAKPDHDGLDTVINCEVSARPQ
ncbi:probable protein phosphatase 2C 65 [Diospyros lotus]|uniref:probable protein phosphatase 2C 65 n=1 Tax=Diospyros lotus TaxID=55363 RepID=UPI002253A9AA|nr:probable protein phosphatase 2C 65 [Diospyros lotus]